MQRPASSSATCRHPHSLSSYCPSHAQGPRTRRFQELRRQDAVRVSRRASRWSSGPNGSGKSNIVDAIKWVLGEQSVKSLRGKEMADVIFNGSGSRRAMNSAEITLTFDNSNHLLPIDTPEVHITRRVYRSGEGEYLINRQPGPAARHPRPALRHGHGHAGLQRHRAGQGRRAAAIVGHATGG